MTTRIYTVNYYLTTCIYKLLPDNMNGIPMIPNRRQKRRPAKVTAAKFP
jgi:hypothetical protein